MTATITSVTYDDTDSSLTVSGTGSGATVSLQRSLDGGNTWTDVYTVDDITGAAWMAADRFAPSSGSVVYQASDDAGTTWSALSAPVAITAGGWWLRDVRLPSLTQRITPEAGNPRSPLDGEVGVFWPLGSQYASVDYGAVHLGRIVLPPIVFWGEPAKDAFVTLIKRGRIQLATDTGALHWIACATLPDIEERHAVRRADGTQAFAASCEFVPVDAP